MSYKAVSTISQGCEFMMCINLLKTLPVTLWAQLPTSAADFKGNDETSLPHSFLWNIRYLSRKTGYQRTYSYYQLFIYI
jgi:hypothetical protein